MALLQRTLFPYLAIGALLGERVAGFLAEVPIFTINQAKHLLMQPGMQVKEVADRLGFPEQFTFRKYFNTHTGVSPTDYREGKTIHSR